MAQFVKGFCFHIKGTEFKSLLHKKKNEFIDVLIEWQKIIIIA